MNESVTFFTIYLALFLCGMIVMRHGLTLGFRKKMPLFLHRFADKPWKGLLTGVLASAITQSSSAVMVMTVGLVAVRAIPFHYSIGIMLGANIGTVATLEILAYDLSSISVPLLLIGGLCLFSTNEKGFATGCVLFGMAMMFISMHGFETLAYPLTSIPSIHYWFVETSQRVQLGVVTGLIMSSIVQSSSAVTAIAMSFMNEQLLGLSSAIAIMLGANIGTCITAWFASLGASKEAKMTAYAHIWVNILGVIICLPFLESFSGFISLLSSSPERQLAHAAFLFNVVSSLIFLPFSDQIARLLKWMHK
ncbi:Na/Pi symporter [Salipaludibacillus sp. LMS25]|jgi:phosphate:Na+ symporter|uniref:Na/Pi symporter n=1 Tax=Salipaludibacillus sp. LMS25 TaxID=2924031 RepID=UPI0020D0D756|nr:Na/Pi symporter [Salipaludibacillus sp. LMS25]UTR14368.1 Na/Pi symporter [Salipaludibacillus sp. LMS25]